MSKVPKIVLSGGPCGGKTESLSYIKRELEKFGFNVFVINEAASLVLEQGFNRNKSAFEFQKAIALKQIDIDEKIEKSILFSYDEYMKNPQMGKNRLMLLIFRYIPRQLWTILLKKYFNISGGTKSFDTLKSEVDKCILVCANCHREIHAGMIKL